MVHKVKIRNMVNSDIPSVVSIHQTAFLGFFLERMGPSFLYEYYSIVLAYPRSICLVAESDQNKISGFVVGFVEPTFFRTFLRTKTIKLIPSILLGIIRSPKIILSIFRNIVRVNRSSNENENALCELSSIAVCPKNKGVGRDLLSVFVAKAWAMQCLEVRLTTDTDNNKKVHEFYLKNNFSVLKHEQRVDRNMTFYVLKNTTVAE